MRRDINEADLRREAAECYEAFIKREADELLETVMEERAMRMDAERRDGLYYDDEPKRKMNPWIYAGVIGSICIGLAAGILWRELTKQ